LALEYAGGGVTRSERLPDPGTVATGAVIVGVAVAVWSGLALVRGQSIQPLESLLFAVVFAFVYFGSLSILGDDTDSETE
jgi:hypothetical protein